MQAMVTHTANKCKDLSYLTVFHFVNENLSYSRVYGLKFVISDDLPAITNLQLVYLNVISVNGN